MILVGEGWAEDHRNLHLMNPAGPINGSRPRTGGAAAARGSGVDSRTPPAVAALRGSTGIQDGSAGGGKRTGPSTCRTVFGSPHISVAAISTGGGQWSPGPSNRNRRTPTNGWNWRRCCVRSPRRC